MNVYFESSFGKRRLLAQDISSKEEAWKVMQNFMNDHQFKCYYTRIWYKDGYTWFDVGSHTEFFLVDEDLMGQYESENKENGQEEQNVRSTTSNRRNAIGYRPE